MKQPSKILLAYSGGLDTTIMLHWLKDTYQCEIIAFCADVGQGKELKGLEEKALNSGASKLIISDLKEDFCQNYAFEALKMGATYESSYLMGTSVARPCIAKEMVASALKHGCDTLAHGATGKGNDQIRFELAFAGLAPNLNVLAPWRSWPFKSRSDLINYASEHNLDITASKEKPYSIDQNLAHTSYEGGILEYPENAPPEDMWQNTNAIEDTPDAPVELSIEFKDGKPISLNQIKMKASDILATLNEVAGTHGVGRLDIVENRFTGMKSRGCYEAPGMTTLFKAHAALEQLCIDREALHLKEQNQTSIANCIYNGFWFAPEFRMLQAMCQEMQKNVTGSVKVKLYKGNVILQGMKSEYSLYKPELSTFEKDEVFSQADASGFIALNALRLKALA